MFSVVIISNSGVKLLDEKSLAKVGTLHSNQTMERGKHMPGKDIMPSLEELQQLIMNGDENFLREMLTKMLNLMMELTR